MAAIKSKNTKPEVLLRKSLFSKGLRYGLHNRQLPGKPDLIFRKYDVAVFVNGCFWHGHENCVHFRLPKTKTDWWNEKISKTKIRDQRKVDSLLEKNWRVATVWECAIKSDLDATSRKLFHFITSQKNIPSQIDIR